MRRPVTAMGLVTRVPEQQWRRQASAHSSRTRALLEPGFVPLEATTPSSKDDGWRRLSKLHPVYNFLEEYYHIKGGKGTRRLARFSAGCSVTLEGASGRDIERGVLGTCGATLMTPQRSSTHCAPAGSSGRLEACRVRQCAERRSCAGGRR